MNSCIFADINVNRRFLNKKHGLGEKQHGMKKTKRKIWPMGAAVWDRGGVGTQKAVCDEDVPFTNTSAVRSRQVLSTVTVKLSHNDWYHIVSQ